MSNITLPQCTGESVGFGAQMFLNLVQTILIAQCSISPPKMWPKDYGETVLDKGLQEYSFIVVGGGSTGSVVASRLSENPNWNVLLLEAGSDPPIESEIPGLNSYLSGSQVDWKFSAASKLACKAHESEMCSIPRGKMLGGTMGILGMIYNRGNKDDYDNWFRLGNVGWDYENVLPYFKKSEGNQYAPFVQFENGTYHSAAGPLKVDFSAEDRMSSYRKMFIDAAAEAGIPTIKDINANKYLGYLEMQGNYFNGRRQSSAKAFLLPAMNRPNLHVIKHAMVEKILINANNEAYGVEFVYNEVHKLKAIARKEVILSAGTYMSSVLLMVSGVGPKDVLDKFDIPVKSDLAVGKNLIDHTTVNLWMKFNPSEKSPLHHLDDIYNLAIHNTGELTSMGVASVNGFINTVNGTGFPDIQVRIIYYKQNSASLKRFVGNYKMNIRQVLLKENENHDIAIIVIILTHPKSRGYVTMKSSSVSDKPIIRPEYFTNKHDLETAIRAIRQQISFTNTSAYQKHGGEFIHILIEECDRFNFQSDDYFRCYINYFGGSNNHPVGTSKMGPDSDADAVVDPRLRVRNINNLRQADGGIMPLIVTGTINAGLIMIGEKVSDMIKEDHGFIQKSIQN